MNFPSFFGLFVKHSDLVVPVSRSKLSSTQIKKINNFFLHLIITINLSPSLTKLLLENAVQDHLAKNLGSVVQSVVSLTGSLRVISLTILADSIYNILIFFAEKMSSFCTAKATHIFQQKISAYLRITLCKF